MDYDNNENEKDLEMVEFVENSNAIVVKINKSYKEGMETFQIYERARGTWTIDKIKRKYIKYVVAVFKGKIEEFFKVAAWFDAGSTLCSIEKIKIEGKSEFVGNLAEDEIREKYNGKPISDFIGKTYNERNYMIVK